MLPMLKRFLGYRQDQFCERDSAVSDTGWPMTKAPNKDKEVFFMSTVRDDKKMDDVAAARDIEVESTNDIIYIFGHNCTRYEQT